MKSGTSRRPSPVRFATTTTSTSSLTSRKDGSGRRFIPTCPTNQPSSGPVRTHELALGRFHQWFDRLLRLLQARDVALRDPWADHRKIPTLLHRVSAHAGGWKFQHWGPEGKGRS